MEMVVPNPPERILARFWPSIGTCRLGRAIGRWSEISWHRSPALPVGLLLALLVVPLAFGVYFWIRLPGRYRRYLLTDRRITILQGFAGKIQEAIGWEEFDEIRLEILPGQRGLRCGDVVFIRAGQSVLCLRSVPLPETFQALCLRIQRTLLAVAQHVGA